MGTTGVGILLAAVLGVGGPVHLAASVPAGMPIHPGGLGISIDLQPATYPVDAAFTAPGPYATTTGRVTNRQGAVIDDTFYPANYGALGFTSPIITWGNGTGSPPTVYTTLLDHFASWGFTVIAPTLENTGSGREIDAAARYLVAQNATVGSVFRGHLDVHRVASVGHSQGATGATNAVTMDPSLYTTLMTFSLPSQIWSLPNPDCPDAAACTPHPNNVHQPVFLISTHGIQDAIIANPLIEREYMESVPDHAVSGIIAFSQGALADHSSIENVANGGDPDDELGYATAWLEYQLLGNTVAAQAFSGPHPEILQNADWPDSAIKQ